MAIGIGVWATCLYYSSVPPVHVVYICTQTIPDPAPSIASPNPEITGAGSIYLAGRLFATACWSELCWCWQRGPIEFHPGSYIHQALTATSWQT